jgi:hypothetical protein
MVKREYAPSKAAGLSVYIREYPWTITTSRIATKPVDFLSTDGTDVHEWLRGVRATQGRRPIRVHL